MRYISFLFLMVLIAGITVAQDRTTVKLKGQVVCSVCWFEAPDRKKTKYGNAADIQCAVDCSEEGVPQALAVEDEKGFTLYELEPGAFKPNGKDFLDLVPKFVEVEGTVRIAKDKRILSVNSLKILDETPAKPIPVSDDAVLSLKDLTGSVQSLENYRGRIVVLNFWATWCEPCRKEMPDLSAIQNDYAALGVQVIGAAGDELADSAKVLRFIREVKVNFPVWVGATTDDMVRFGVGEVLPATVIIDKNGKIVWREIGMIKPDVLRKELDKLLLPQVAKAEETAKQAVKELTKNASLVPA
ncbi:TlpA family protein disulfide reductase [Leptolyngbya sp. 7M]|uniref:TlpA family protein disulfide reductase n=1 Tax=Leptolyngbya sp. 7M TaxID=2812896 RepID=UPI001B8AE82C|nr:TlpA disulfide reductase family protein [Leptolyngbya sp. 7M]QYO67650.1 TlpA family protein disulfide reductase [Leptolyngbya sp. 7M]